MEYIRQYLKSNKIKKLEGCAHHIAQLFLNNSVNKETDIKHTPIKVENLNIMIFIADNLSKEREIDSKNTRLRKLNELFDNY